MSLNLFWVVSDLTSRKANLTPLAAIGYWQEAELSVINEVGGINNPSLSRLFRQIVRQNIAPGNNVVDLPDGCSRVIKALVEGDSYSVLNVEDEAAHGKSTLFSKSAIIDGGHLRFEGLPFRKVLAEVIVERPMVSTVYIEGLKVYKTVMQHTKAGVTHPVYAIQVPTQQQFQTDALSGGILRVVVAGDYCTDFEISGNEYFGREAIFVLAPGSRQPVSWIRHSSEPVPQISEDEVSTKTTLRSVRNDGPMYPGAIMRTMLPDTLRPLALTYARWKVTGQPAFYAEYQEQLKNWRIRNAS